MGFGMPDSRINTLLVTEWVAMPLQCQAQGVAQPHGLVLILQDVKHRTIPHWVQEQDLPEGQLYLSHTVY